MTKLVPTVGPYETPPLKGVSWGAIFGGTLISLAVMVVLGSLGIAIGATSIDPMTGETPTLRAFSIGSGIWWIGSGIVTLFAGGWAASRLAGPRRRLESTLHGLITWALTTTVSVVLMATVIGSMVSGAMRMLGTATGYAVQGAGAVAGQLISDQRGANDGPDVDIAWNEVWSEAQQLLRQTKQPQLQPGEIRQDVEQAARELGQALDQESPEAMGNEIEAVLSRFYRGARENVTEVDREAAVNVLVARTDMSREQARQVVNRWADRMQNAWKATSQSVQTAGAEVKQAAVRAAEGTANAVAGAAWWSFFYLLLGASSAGVGGLLGAFRRRQEGVTLAETRITP